MPITQNEVEILLDDTSKRIEGDISWSEDADHSPAVEFRAEVQSDLGYPLVVFGRYNPLALSLSYTLLHRGTGRIYALDLGADHHNPTCQNVGEKHKHRWTDVFKDKEAYVPDDITAPPTDPVTVWKQFCLEAKIDHRGKLAPPPPHQRDLDL
jgi:hypothetical protein